MILTQCVVCATDLGLTRGKKCGRCSTRYCGAACQVQHWKEGGHDKLCKLIKRGGGAEQYNADQRYTKAVAVAVEKCAEDTKGQTCYICTQALHWKTKEGLVRGCSCRGTAGFAHVSCLAEQAKILFEEAWENNLDWEVKNERWTRWYSCSLCKQDYHGVVRCALGWACWKTYIGRPKTDQPRRRAMNVLGTGLYDANHQADALIVGEAEISMERHLGASEADLLATKGNLANSYEDLGRFEESLLLRREVYYELVGFMGEEHTDTLKSANNYASSLVDLRRFEEVKSLLRKTMPVARRVLGENDETTIRMQWTCGKALYLDANATLDDLRKAVTLLEEAPARRVLGGVHPLTTAIEGDLPNARAALRARGKPPGAA